MKISNTGVAITNRFFTVLEYLSMQKEIRGLKTFTDKYDINRRNLIIIKREPEIRVLKPEYLSILVEDYRVNATWLLTGRGSMFV